MIRISRNTYLPPFSAVPVHRVTNTLSYPGLLLISISIINYIYSYQKTAAFMRPFKVLMERKSL